MRTEVEGFTEDFGRLMALTAQIRQHQATEGGVDFGAIRHLAILRAAGPMRASELAERAKCDPALVTRISHHLAERGLLARVPDPVDGRAALLAVTEAGAAAVDKKRGDRSAAFHRMLADWSEEEVREFHSFLTRFLVGLEHEVEKLNQQQQRDANV